ncbi:MAG: alpha/beta hydrolase [Stenomitos rutilans HA7619-LM2]|jgi:pimeloyl-ACP methyl ester carboxylesterase|nr:alpha/beta hydrolase [Stenomitos rutilans HA7619-LM2]
MGGTINTYQWSFRGQEFPIVYETRGYGHQVLLLPAFSTVSTRGEMGGLAGYLASEFQVIALDWLGFGDSARPAIAYQPEVYQQLLQSFVQDVCDHPLAVVAAGHAAGYVLQAGAIDAPWSKMVLVAPTWRGPLPTMMGKQQPWFATIRQTVGTPVLGQTLYKLNTLPSFLRFMYRQHVYTNPAMLTPAFIEQKYQITQQPGARFAPAAFVTGGLDPVATREAFLQPLQRLKTPLLVLIGDQSPAASKAEMDALAACANVQSVRLPGSLGLHEEYAAEVAQLTLPFLR